MHIFAQNDHQHHEQHEEPTTEDATAQATTTHQHDDSNDIRGAIDALAAVIQPQQPTPPTTATSDVTQQEDMEDPYRGETWVYIYHVGCTLQHAHTAFAAEDVLRHVTPHHKHWQSKPYLVIPLNMTGDTPIQTLLAKWRTPRMH
eukprot:11544928-Prorocentrum_lima.AAC.1